MKSSIERWNKSSVCYVQVVWFGSDGEVNPGYFGLFSTVVELGSWRIALTVLSPYTKYATSGVFWC